MTEPTPHPQADLSATEPAWPSPQSLRRRATAMLLRLLALLLASAAYVLYARGAFEPKQQLVLLADDAEGAVVGMELTFAGFSIGQVERIALDDDGVVRLHVAVPSRHGRWLRTSSVVTMERSLVGSTRLRAYSGVLSDPALPDGAEITVLKGDAMADIPRLLATVREVMDNAKALTADQSALARTLANVATTTDTLRGPQGALGLLVGNEADARRLMATLDQAQALLTRLDGVAKRTDGLLAHADERVFGEQGLSRDAQQVAQEAQALLVGLQATVRSVQASLQRVDALLVDGQAIASNTRAASVDLVALRAEVEASLRALQGMVSDVQRRWPFGPSAQDAQVMLP